MVIYFKDRDLFLHGDRDFVLLIEEYGIHFTGHNQCVGFSLLHIVHTWVRAVILLIREEAIYLLFIILHLYHWLGFILYPYYQLSLEDQ